MADIASALIQCPDVPEDFGGKERVPGSLKADLRMSVERQLRSRYQVDLEELQILVDGAVGGGGTNAMVLCARNDSRLSPSWEDSYAQWLSADHSADLPASMLLLEFGDRASQIRALESLPDLVAARFGDAAAAPLRGSAFVELSSWVLLDAERESRPGPLAFLGLRPGDPDAILGVGREFTKMGYELLGEYYLEAVPPAIVGDEAVLRRKLELERPQLSALVFERDVASRLSALSLTCGRFRLRDRPADGAETNARGVRAAAVDFLASGDRSQALQLSRALFAAGLTAHAYSIAWGAIRSFDEVKTADMLLLLLMHEELVLGSGKREVWEELASRVANNPELTKAWIAEVLR